MPGIRLVRPDVARRMRASAIAFQDKVWPAIAHDFAGRFEAVEGKNEQETLAKILDNCGIDAFVVHEEPHHHAFGIAARTWNAWEAGASGWTIPRGFSLRHSIKRGDEWLQNCEYHKLRYVFIENIEGAIRPHYTIQATFLNKATDDRPIYVVSIQTRELILYIDAHWNDPSCVTDRLFGKATRFYDVAAVNLADCPSFREYVFEKPGFSISDYTQGGIVRGYWIHDDSIVEDVV